MAMLARSNPPGADRSALGTLLDSDGLHDVDSRVQAPLGEALPPAEAGEGDTEIGGRARHGAFLRLSIEEGRRPRVTYCRGARRGSTLDTLLVAFA